MPVGELKPEGTVGSTQSHGPQALVALEWFCGLRSVNFYDTRRDNVCPCEGGEGLAQKAEQGSFPALPSALHLWIHILTCSVTLLSPLHPPYCKVKGHIQTLDRLAAVPAQERGVGLFRPAGFNDFFRPWLGPQKPLLPLTNWANNNEKVLNCAPESVLLLPKIMKIPPKDNNCWHCSCACLVLLFRQFWYFHVYFKDKLKERLFRVKITLGPC